LQPVDDVHRELHSAVGEKLQDDGGTSAGGIDIDVARQRLMEQDKIDKRMYQEKIKQKHRVSNYTYCQ